MTISIILPNHICVSTFWENLGSDPIVLQKRIECPKDIHTVAPVNPRMSRDLEEKMTGQSSNSKIVTGALLTLKKMVY